MSTQRMILRAAFVLVGGDQNVVRECPRGRPQNKKTRCRGRESFQNMNVLDQRNSTQTIVGIDLGGKHKGFHAVALLGGGPGLTSYRFLDRARASRNRASATKTVTKITSR